MNFDSASRFERLLDEMPQLAWSADSEGDVIYANRRCTEYTGIDVADKSGGGWAQSLHSDDAVLVYQLWQEAIKKKIEFQCEYRLRSVTGDFRWFLGRAVPIKNEDGQVLEWFGSATDIQNQKLIESELQMARKDADAANEAKSQFLANMSHEIRTPLGVMLGYTELVLESTTLDDESRVYLTAARNNGEMLKKVIGELLDLAKIESEKLELEIIQTDLQKIVSEVVKSFEMKAAEKSTQLIVKNMRPISFRVMTDPTAVRQILTNLIANAIRFTEAGRITIEMNIENLSDKYARVSFGVEDTGLGIAIEHQKNLFQSFYQAKSKANGRHSGTGLGLVISQKLAHLLGGDVELARSQIGVGSQFNFHFQVESIQVESTENRKNPAAAESDDSVLHLKGRKVLVVEDSADNRELVSHYLERAGAEVTTAGDGKSGIARAVQDQPDLILMDIQMPGIDGHEAMAQLRRLNFKKPIVALTANALKSERDRAMNLGFTSYLTKPLDRRKLINTLSELTKMQVGENV